MTKKFILLVSVAVLVLGNTSEARAKISCVFSNNNAKVTISGEGSDVASASACNDTNSSSTDDGWTYNPDWKNSATSVDIGKGITRIGGWAFYGMSSVTSLTISKGVTSIGSNAFDGMSRVTGELVIPDSVTSIGQAAFRYMSGVTSLTIPNSVKSIEGIAFMGMSGVTGKLKIPEGITEIGGSTFSGMSGVTGELKIPDGVTSIGGLAFMNMSGVTGELVIPDSVTSIGRAAFQGMSGVTSMVIPDSLTSAGPTTFIGMSGLKSLVIPDSINTDEWDVRAFQGLSADIVCLGETNTCYKKLARYFSPSNCPTGITCSCTSYCINPNLVVKAAENEKQCVGMYHWNGNSCNRMTEWQCNDYRDKNNKRKYYYNGNTCTKLPKDGKIACANSCYKINDGYCDRICYTPAEAAEIAKDSGNVVTLTFKKQ